MAVEYRCCGTGFLVRVGILILLVLFAGLMSGLKSLSLVYLEVLSKSRTPDDRKRAAKVLPVVKGQHLLFCTLLICNAAAMEALPIFLDGLVRAWGAILISVTLILLFVEIIPQAVFSRHGLAIGAAVAPVVELLVWICFPVAYPMSKLLELLSGKGPATLFGPAELKTLVETLVDLLGNEAGKGGELTHDETTIIAGVLDLTKKTARDAMTPISNTFSVDINSEPGKTLMTLFLEKGHSRVPVYHEQSRNIIGLILVKNFPMIHPDDEVSLRNGPNRKIPRVPETMPLDDILNEFRKGHSHMAVVVRQLNMDQSASENLVPEVKVDVDGESHAQNKNLKSFQNDADPQRGNGIHSEVLPLDEDPLPGLTEEAEAIGIITSEDVNEEHSQEEIYDETDHLD